MQGLLVLPFFLNFLKKKALVRVIPVHQRLCIGQGDAPTLTLPRRERELLKDPALRMTETLTLPETDDSGRGRPEAAELLFC